MPRTTYIYSRKKLTYRTTLPLTRQMDAALSAISKKCKDLNGIHIDKSQIIRSVIAVLAKLEDQVDWVGIKDEAELVERLLKAFSKK